MRRITSRTKPFSPETSRSNSLIAPSPRSAGLPRRAAQAPRGVHCKAACRYRLSVALDPRTNSAATGPSLGGRAATPCAARSRAAQCSARIAAALALAAERLEADSGARSFASSIDPGAMRPMLPEQPSESGSQDPKPLGISTLFRAYRALSDAPLRVRRARSARETPRFAPSRAASGVGRAARCDPARARALAAESRPSRARAAHPSRLARCAIAARALPPS